VYSEEKMRHARTLEARRIPLVLVVDDDTDTRELYRLVLNLSGLEVADAGGVRQAADTARVVRPDAVLTDWWLPDGDGFRLSELLRAHPSTRRIPMAAVTGLAMDSSTLLRTRQAGFERVLEKPVEPEIIIAAVNQLLDVVMARRLCAVATRIRRHAARIGVAAGPPADVRAAAAELLARASAHSAGPITLMFADDRAHYVAVNSNASELTGYDSRELLGLSVWDLTPPPVATSGQNLWRSFLAAGSQQGHYLMRRRDGAAVEAQYCAIANVAPGLHVSAITPLHSARF
jgi:PAS domain S-box-containing protein